MGRLRTLGPRVAELQHKGPAAPLTSGTMRTRGRALQVIRHRILTRDQGLCHCARCTSTGAVRIARDVDHGIPIWAGGPEDDGNRFAISPECHAEKSRAEESMRAAGFTPTGPADWLEWHRPRPAAARG